MFIISKNLALLLVTWDFGKSHQFYNMKAISVKSSTQTITAQWRAKYDILHLAIRFTDDYAKEISLWKIKYKETYLGRRKQLLNQLN